MGIDATLHHVLDCLGIVVALHHVLSCSTSRNLGSSAVPLAPSHIWGMHTCVGTVYDLARGIVWVTRDGAYNNEPLLYSLLPVHVLAVVVMVHTLSGGNRKPRKYGGTNGFATIPSIPRGPSMNVT